MLEDIAETFRYLVFGPTQLNKGSGFAYATLGKNNAALNRRRAFLEKEGTFPTSWSRILQVGALYKGEEKEPHLENWFVEV